MTLSFFKKPVTRSHKKSQESHDTTASFFMNDKNLARPCTTLHFANRTKPDQTEPRPSEPNRTQPSHHFFRIARFAARRSPFRVFWLGGLKFGRLPSLASFASCKTSVSSKAGPWALLRLACRANLSRHSPTTAGASSRRRVTPLLRLCDQNPPCLLSLSRFACRAVALSRRRVTLGNPPRRLVAP